MGGTTTKAPRWAMVPDTVGVAIAVGGAIADGVAIAVAIAVAGYRPDPPAAGPRRPPASR